MILPSKFKFDGKFVYFLADISQQTFVHVMTAQFSCHEQHFVAIAQLNLDGQMQTCGPDYDETQFDFIILDFFLFRPFFLGTSELKDIQ